MAKCLVGTTGGGKITVEGLAAEVLLTGSAAKVFRGAKQIVSIDGELDVLAWCANYNNGNGYYWNGNSYVGMPYSPNITIGGKPLLGYACNHSANGFTSWNICGKNFTSIYTPTQFVPTSNKISSSYAVGKNAGYFVILGTK